MADEKQFEPTQNRLARAKKDGDVSRSSGITATASFGCAALGASLAMPIAYAACRGALIAAATGKGVSSCSYVALAGAALVPMLSAGTGSLAATFLQTRSIVFRLPGLKFEKLDPVQGFKRMFSRDAAMSAVKACAAATATTAAVLPEIGNTMLADGVLMHHVGSVCASLRTILTTSVAIGFVFGFADFISENKKRRRRLRMSFDELKRDVKQSEGDPLMRNRRKQTHRTLLRGSVSNLHKAAFVIANPSHIAIALEYHPPEVEVPRVLIRAAGNGAQLVKRRAVELDIPIIEDIPTARALFASTEAGSYIPRETFVAVAEIVAALTRRTA
jgi:flagellar biosynthesis protein FlhB